MEEKLRRTLLIYTQCIVDPFGISGSNSRDKKNADPDYTFKKNRFRIRPYINSDLTSDTPHRMTHFRNLRIRFSKDKKNPDSDFTFKKNRFRIHPYKKSDLTSKYPHKMTHFWNLRIRFSRKKNADPDFTFKKNRSG